MSDLISRQDAIKVFIDWGMKEFGFHDFNRNERFIDALSALPSAEAKKKKAELKENGDWDCPDVGCYECDHHRSVEWCSLAIPNHEEIDETYKMVNEAFFKGFGAAEKQYRLLIETIEELDKESAEAVQGEWGHMIADGVDGSHWYEYECSHCGEVVLRPYNYCPNCGARMRREDDAPTIDAVEVVRCKDCIHYESDGGAMMICNITDMVCDNDDFCSYGERREDGEA